MKVQDYSSLGSLSKRFQELIEETEDGILDLREVADCLEVPKRRVYDVTNVLEGVDLLEKTSRNTVRWKSGQIDCRKREFMDEDKERNLELEIKQLEEMEAKFELEIQNVLNKTQMFIENEKTKGMLYLASNDIEMISSLKLRQVFAFQTPEKTQIYRCCLSKHPAHFYTKFFAENPNGKIGFHDISKTSTTRSAETNDGTKENQKLD
eukprot:g1512.t1